VFLLIVTSKLEYSIGENGIKYDFIIVFDRPLWHREYTYVKVLGVFNVIPAVLEVIPQFLAQLHVSLHGDEFTHTSLPHVLLEFGYHTFLIRVISTIIVD